MQFTPTLVGFSPEDMVPSQIKGQMGQDKECMSIEITNPGTQAVTTHQVNFRRDGGQIADANGNTWLHVGALIGNEQMVSGFLEQCRSLDLETRNAAGETPLMAAAKGGNVAIVQALLAKKVDLFAINHKTGAQAFHVAVEAGSIPMVAALLDAGARVNDLKSNEMKWSALHSAADKGDPRMVEFLLARGAQLTKAAMCANFTGLTVPEVVEGVTPLILAAQSGNEETVRLLLKAGDDPHQCLSDGSNVLHWAWRHPPICTLLLTEYKVNPNQKSKDGIVPCQMVENLQLMKCYLEHGAEADFPDEKGITLLGRRCRLFNAEDPEWIILLLTHGADPNRKIEGQTIFSRLFHHIRYAGYPPISAKALVPIVKLFIEKGAESNFDLRDNFNNCSPLISQNPELQKLIRGMSGCVLM